MKLYINNQLVDLGTDSIIAQTKVINDMASIQTRQASFTNTFNIPKTANNLRIMEMMTLAGNTSLLPYRKNEVSLYADSGECFVYKGWSIITDEGKNFSVAIVDGIIDLYKAIENKTLSDLTGLSALVHSKDIATVVASMASTSLPYRYILADYNGNTGPVNTTDDNPIPQVNIDYLVPSVNVAWLWDLIMSEHGVTYSGAIFNMFNFKNLWMTFPKGTGTTGENDHEIFESYDYTLIANGAGFAKFNTASLNELSGSVSNIHMRVADTATYRIEIKGTLYGKRTNNSALPATSKIVIAKNSTGTSFDDARDALDNEIYGLFSSDANQFPSSVETPIVSKPFQLQANDTIAIVLRNVQGGVGYLLSASDANELEVKLYRVDANVIDFTTAFTDFGIKDFLTEIVQRFGLTIFKDKFSNTYEFLTLQEQLQNGEVYDWSDKFDSKVSENYAFSNYSQRNFYRYNYNDKEGSHNDAYIAIDNVNLTDARDVFKSKIYSPERINVLFLDEKTNVYKLWDKEIKENPASGEPINYKPLDKRYYFMRSVTQVKTVKLYSLQTGLNATVNSIYRESFYKLSFQDIMADYYANLQRILQRVIIVKAKVLLNDVDIVNIDFKKLVYIEQLSNYFMLNKVEQYIQGRLTSVELVRVIYSDEPETISNITITSGSSTIQGSFKTLLLSYIKNYTTGTLKVERSQDQLTWTDIAVSYNDASVVGLMPGSLSGLYYFRIVDVDFDIISNPYAITL